MSFNVTQCPACESTFNTNSRVLTAAAGKVRCGACLNVFEAVDHFLTPDPAADQIESVFVGNNPQEYFDPSNFLTRSALRESPGVRPEASDLAAQQSPIESLARSETVSEEFFSNVVGELQGRGENEPPSLADTAYQAEPLPSVDSMEEIDDDFEAAILNNFTAAVEPNIEPAQRMDQAPVVDSLQPSAESSQAIPGNAPALDSERTRNDATMGPATESEFAETDNTDAESVPVAQPESKPEPQPIAENPASTNSFGFGLSASFSFSPYSRPEPPTHVIEPELEQIEADSAEETAAASFESADDDSINAPEAELEALPQANAAEESHIDAEEETEAEPDSFAVAERGDSQPEAEPPINLDAQEAEQQLLEDAGVICEASIETQEDKSPTSDSSPVSGESEVDEATGEIAPPQHDESDEESSETIRARALRAELQDEEALEAIPREHLAALGQMSSPLELLSKGESRLLRSALLLFCILLLGGLLSGQYLWQRMDLYSQVPQLRGLFEFACKNLSCELPEFTAIDAIRSENLTVRTHPTIENALIVNTVIRNTADFEQAFPILILSFNSAANSVIALREFSPNEYLDPGLRSIRMMPPMTSVQISLTLMDPGSEAVNYTLAFRLP